MVKYKPFIIQINPKSGGQSEIPVSSPDNLKLDIRTNFNLYSVDLTTGSVNPKTKGSIIREAWTNFYKTTGANGGNLNDGAKKPVSSLDTSNGYDNTKNLDMTLGYISQTDRSVVINPEMWKSSNGEYVNGVFIPQVAYSTDGSNPDKQRFIPFAIWFDENF